MPPGLIVVGTGKWGRNHVSTAATLSALRAVVDSDPNALENVNESLTSTQLKHVTYHSSLRQALQKHPEAAVIVATPPATHFALAEEALLAGRHVLVEKPFCLNLQHASQLVQLAEKRRLVLMVDHMLQYSFHHRSLLQLVKNGYIGDITRIRMSRLNFGTIRLEENVLWSFSPHDISILLSLCTGKLLKSVSCSGQCLISKGIEDHIDLALEFDDGLYAKIEASWMHPLKERRTIVYGATGSVILNEASPDPTTKKLQGFKWSAKRRADGSSVAIEKSEEDVMEGAYEGMRSGCESIEKMRGKQPLQLVLEHFLACIESGETPRTDGTEALQVVRVLTAASASLEKGGSRIEMKDWIPQGMFRDSSTNVFVHSSAVVDSGAVIGAGSKVWHFSHVMSGAQLGESCNIGQNVYIGGKARLGRNVKVQNNVSVYDRVEVDDDAFLGPSCVFTNVKTPRSHISRKEEFARTTVEKGATIGANATIVCGVMLGRYCLVGAGAVVTKDVPAHAMVYGNPATIHGWVSTTGARLLQIHSASGPPQLQCKESGEVYTLDETGDKLGITLLSASK